MTKFISKINVNSEASPCIVDCINKLLIINKRERESERERERAREREREREKFGVIELCITPNLYRRESLRGANMIG